MIDVDQLAKLVRSVNEANGWKVFYSSEWQDNEYKFPAIIALIHSEITEAWWELDARKWELFIEELADVKIRILDVAGGMTHDFGQYFDQSTLFAATFQDDLLGAHKDATEALESFRKGDKERALAFLAHLYMRCNHVSESFAYDYHQIMLDKIEKNRKRSYRHGNKRV